jgi:hypothetical protein
VGGGGGAKSAEETLPTLHNYPNAIVSKKTAPYSTLAISVLWAKPGGAAGGEAWANNFTPIRIG